MKKLFEYYVEDESLHVKYARGEPARRDTEFHDYSEFVYFVDGDSYFISKNAQQQLVCGSIVAIPQENYHQFIINDNDSYTRCIIGFRRSADVGALADEVMDTIRIIESPDKRITDLFDSLTEIMASNLSDAEKLMFARASLMQLLIRVKQHVPKEQEVCSCTVVSKALDIIDTRYAEKLTLEALAGLLYVSPSTLSHRFKDELNISVYQYITKKRLSAAHSLISRGEPMTLAATKCGFSDYSCFYRLYKKYYVNV